MQSGSIFNKSMRSKATTTKSKKSRGSTKPVVTEAEPELEVVDIISPRKEKKDDDS